MIKAAFKIHAAFLRKVLLCLVAIICYGYTLFGSDLAEWDMKFSFLNFPIFIGEVILLISAVLLMVYYFPRFSQIDRKLLFILIFYLAWVFIKTFLSYAVSGPLALRTAALFYYPLFAIVGYTIFQKDDYRFSIKILIWLFLILNLFLAPVSDYFVLSYWLLALGISLTLRPVWLKLLSVCILGLHALYLKFLFVGSRSHLIGIGIMLIFVLGYYLIGLLKLRWKMKIWTLFFVFVLISLGLSLFGDRNALKSMVTFQHLREYYHELDRDIQNQKLSFTKSPLTPKIFYENPNNRLRIHFPLSQTTNQISSMPVTDQSALSNEDIRAINEYTDEFLKRTTNASESEIQQRAGEIYLKSREILKRQNAVIISQAKQELDEEIQILINESQGLIEDDVKEAMQSLSLALKRDSAKSVEMLKRIADDASQNTIDKISENIKQKQKTFMSNLLMQKADRSIEVAYNNILFRLFIWRDMFNDLKEENAWWGMDFGHPQRSISIEILGWAVIEWRRDGWITPHNSFLHMIYRGGIIGGLCVLSILGLIIYLTRGFYRHRSVWGGLLTAALVYWISISNFLVFLELPYNAIPFWTFVGMTVAYLHSLNKATVKENSVMI